ncbi:hypothetical protein TNCV_732711 [Trichonephila clavipes]|nr:hypothetical protein TNCV_732711 [Trichonephila clavipes]
MDSKKICKEKEPDKDYRKNLKEEHQKNFDKKTRYPPSTRYQPSAHRAIDSFLKCFSSSRRRKKIEKKRRFEGVGKKKSKKAEEKVANQRFFKY